MKAKQILVLSVEEARKSLLRTEPFQKYPVLVAKLGLDK